MAGHGKEGKTRPLSDVLIFRLHLTRPWRSGAARLHVPARRLPAKGLGGQRTQSEQVSTGQLPRTRIICIGRANQAKRPPPAPAFHPTSHLWHRSLFFLSARGSCWRLLCMAVPDACRSRGLGLSIPPLHPAVTRSGSPTSTARWRKSALLSTSASSTS